MKHGRSTNSILVSYLALLLTCFGVARAQTDNCRQYYLCQGYQQCVKSVNAVNKLDAQSCHTPYDAKCIPPENVESVCGNSPAGCFPQPSCAPVTSQPSFVVVSLLYAPPGNASSNSFGNSSTIGTSIGDSSNFSSSDSVSIDTKIGFQVSWVFTFGASVDVSTSLGTSNGTSNSSTLTLSTTATTNNQLTSGSDLIDHGQDVFYVWLNPLITITQTGLSSFSTSVSTIGGLPMDIRPVSARALQNHSIPQVDMEDQQISPSNGSPGYSLPGFRHLTSSDYVAILSLDPFLDSASANPPYSPANHRFLLIQTRPLESKSQDSFGTTQAFTISDSQSTSLTSSTVNGGSDSSSIGVSASLSGSGVSVKDTTSWTWQYTTTTGQNTGSSQQASVTLASTTPTCCENRSGNGNCEVDIYEDMMFHTFAFVPERETCAMPIMVNTSLPPLPPLLLRGIVLDAEQKPAGNQRVEIRSSDGKLLRVVFTNSKGEYSVGSLPTGPVSIMSGGVVTHEIIVANSTQRPKITLAQPIKK